PLQAKYFGGHFEMLEVDELAAFRQNIGEAEVEARVALFYQNFEMDATCHPGDIREAALTSVALDRLVERYSLGSLVYYYKGTANSTNQTTISSIILGTSLLTGRGIPVAGEYEIKNAQAMKIMDKFGAGGSFTEYYAMDYADDVVIMGHDGPGHIAIAEGNVRVKPLQVYHGKVGSGLSLEMTVQHGPITCLSVVETGKGELILLVAEGASVPGPTLKIGNTNSRYRFAIGARAFVQEWNGHGPAHHCAVGKGHIASKIKKLGALLQMEVRVVG
ncbi:MAG: arabinose isomerase, partial [Chitinophagaceae bacterium]